MALTFAEIQAARLKAMNPTPVVKAATTIVPTPLNTLIAKSGGRIPAGIQATPTIQGLIAKSGGAIPAGIQATPTVQGMIAKSSGAVPAGIQATPTVQGMIAKSGGRIPAGIQATPVVPDNSNPSRIGVAPPIVAVPSVNPSRIGVAAPLTSPPEINPSRIGVSPVVTPQSAIMAGRQAIRDQMGSGQSTGTPLDASLAGRAAIRSQAGSGQSTATPTTAAQVLAQRASIGAGSAPMVFLAPTAKPVVATSTGATTGTGTTTVAKDPKKIVTAADAIATGGTGTPATGTAPLVTEEEKKRLYAAEAVMNGTAETGTGTPVGAITPELTDEEKKLAAEMVNNPTGVGQVVQTDTTGTGTTATGNGVYGTGNPYDLTTYKEGTPPAAQFTDAAEKLMADWADDPLWNASMYKPEDDLAYTTFRDAANAEGKRAYGASLGTSNKNGLESSSVGSQIAQGSLDAYAAQVRKAIPEFMEKDRLRYNADSLAKFTKAGQMIAFDAEVFKNWASRDDYADAENEKNIAKTGYEVVDLNAIPKDSWVWKIKDYSVEIKARQDKDPSDPWIGILQEVRDAKILGNEDLYKKYGNSITGSQGIISKAKVSAAAATAADAITRDDAQKIAEDKSNQEWAKIDETKRSNAAKELISRTKATNASGASKITADQKAEMATIMQSMIASGDPVAFLQNLPAGAISKAELDILMPMAKAGTYNDESLVMANASPEQRKYFQGLVAEFDKQDAATALSNLEKAPNSTAKDPLGAYLYRLLVKRLTERQTSEKTAEIKNPPPVKATDPKYDVSNDPISTRVIQMQNETTNSVNADGDPVKVPRFTEADLVRYIEANTSGDPIRGSKVKTYTGVMSSSTQAPK